MLHNFLYSCVFICQKRLLLLLLLSVLEEELNVKEKDIETAYNKLQILQNEKLSLQQRIRGLKSGIARKIKVQASSFPAPSSASDKHVDTDINDICMNDIIVDNNDKGGILRVFAILEEICKRKQQVDG